MQRKAGTNLVRNTRKEANLGDKFAIIENNRDYNRNKETGMPFFQLRLTYPPQDKTKDHCQMMMFANPALLGLLKTPQLDVYVLLQLLFAIPCAGTDN